MTSSLVVEADWISLQLQTLSLLFSPRAAPFLLRHSPGREQQQLQLALIRAGMLRSDVTEDNGHVVSPQYF
jgi:hypothetical protein